jgi:NAD-dependent SIR2 family protein deacetylase
MGHSRDKYRKGGKHGHASIRMQCPACRMQVTKPVAILDRLRRLGERPKCDRCRATLLRLA